MAAIATAQLARKTKEAQGPRALGLVELSADGSARLIPICIMVDGKFYDAGAYKASPVPFALWNDTVYEAEKTGVSQGLFTVGEATRTGNDNWFAEGRWRAAGSEPKPRRKATKPKLDDDEGPPKLRRAEPEKPESAGTQSPPASTPAPADDKKSPPSGSESVPAPAATAAPPASTDQRGIDIEGVTDANDEDPNRPILKRGKTETLAKAHPQVGASTGVPRRPAGAAAKAEAKAAPQAIPAISDASGPEPRPYMYDIKPDEEQKYRKGMLALAADAVLARAKETAPVVPGTKPVNRASARTVRAAQPSFDDVQFRAFDLWNTNEPVFVLSATAHLPKAASTDTSDDRPYYVTLVAKRNIYDELHKLYAGVTDAKHLDETPRLELIDAVDADGDGRGELLFRRVFDVGSAWAVYRAGADQLFPLFEGTPGQ